MPLEASSTVEIPMHEKFFVKFNHLKMTSVMLIIKEINLNVLDQKLELDCEIYISVRKKNSEKIFQKLNAIYKVEIKKPED